MIQIDRIRLTAVAKNQLITLKRKTGINHYNTLCRYALCLSLTNETIPPVESFNFNGGIDIEWRTLTGGYDSIYLNLILLICDEKNENGVRASITNNLHRGLAFLAGMKDEDLKKIFTDSKY